VGQLDMSTAAAAYANLVGVPAAGTGPGTSGVTCGSLAPSLLRVKPNDSASSLLYDKVNSGNAAALRISHAHTGRQPAAPARAGGAHQSLDRRQRTERLAAARRHAKSLQFSTIEDTRDAKTRTFAGPRINLF